MSNFISIKNLPEDDKPREKLTLKGKSSLSNAELLAIILGTGTTNKSAIDLAREIMQKANNDLNELAKFSIKDFCRIDGVGPAKSIAIIAAIELSGRREYALAKEKAKVRCSNDVYTILKHRLMDLNYEEFWLLTLSRSGTVISERKISEGGISGTVVDSRKIFKHALDDFASGIVVCHNHPSGNLKPSEQDIALTKKIKEAGKLLDINLMDHLIITQQSYFSFADEGIL